METIDIIDMVLCVPMQDRFAGIRYTCAYRNQDDELVTRNYTVPALSTTESDSPSATTEETTTLSSVGMNMSPLPLKEDPHQEVTIERATIGAVCTVAAICLISTSVTVIRYVVKKRGHSASYEPENSATSEL